MSYRHALINRTVNTGIFSQELSILTGYDSTQIRRDLKRIGNSGSKMHGYKVKRLIDRIDSLLNTRESIPLFLVSDNTYSKQAIINYFDFFTGEAMITHCFDQKLLLVDPNKNIPLTETIKNIEMNKNRPVIILAVANDTAQLLAEKLFFLGFKGFLNLSATPVLLPKGAIVETFDLPKALTKTIFFALRNRHE